MYGPCDNTNIAYLHDLKYNILLVSVSCALDFGS